MKVNVKVITTRSLSFFIFTLLACARNANTAPVTQLGEFADDYGIRYRITESEWTQLPRARYHIVKWAPAAGYLVARNDPANPSDGGLWTRIDWVPLTGMPPYEWAFCLSVYKAPTQAAAETSSVARKDTPRTGCNGHPFSRMRRQPTGSP
jgi:hypothetical protein